MMNSSELSTALVVIDVQGKLAALVHDHEHVLANVLKAVRIAQILNLPILWTEQAPDKIGATVESVSQLLFPVIKPIVKRSFSCYGSDEFRQTLSAAGCSDVLIVGIETHVCVYQTARDLVRHGYHVDVAVDAVSARSLQCHTIAVERMRDMGAGITSVEMATCDLMVTADHPKFREVMSHIKR